MMMGASATGGACVRVSSSGPAGRVDGARERDGSAYIRDGCMRCGQACPPSVLAKRSADQNRVWWPGQPAGGGLPLNTSH